ncbi:hypothetical protein LCGC14_1444420 [marine sediment metagenome]|uniref:Uncharacterized protein n=1 Tax=marine sediment metagenome TaxID=412755 RepID=A0A0F9JKB9_9ZZZZ
MSLPWETPFGKSQVSDRHSGGKQPEEFNPKVDSLKCNYCGKVSQIKPGTENSNSFRCSHCGLVLKTNSPIRNPHFLVLFCILQTSYQNYRVIYLVSVPYLSLYDEGTDHKGYGEGIFKRMGCVLCPFARNIESEEEYFPEIVKLWKLACERLTVATKERGYLNKRGKPVKHRFEPGTDQMYDWWVARK